MKALLTTQFGGLFQTDQLVACQPELDKHSDRWLVRGYIKGGHSFLLAGEYLDIEQAADSCKTIMGEATKYQWAGTPRGHSDD